MISVEAKIKRVQKKFNFDAPKFVREALGIVKMDIQEGIANRRQIDGSSMPSLAPVTIAMKEQSQGFGRMRKKTRKEQSVTKDLKQRRAGVAVSPDHPLIDTGNLLKNQVIEVDGIDGVLRIGPDRSEIGKKLQVEGVGKYHKKFLFFGISNEAVEDIRTLLRKRWSESFEIKRG